MKINEHCTIWRLNHVLNLEYACKNQLGNFHFLVSSTTAMNALTELILLLCFMWVWTLCLTIWAECGWDCSAQGIEENLWIKHRNEWREKLRKLHNEELHNFYSPKTVRVGKSRMMHVVLLGNTRYIQTFGVKPCTSET
jgi:hypothetical protein